MFHSCFQFEFNWFRSKMDPISARFRGPCWIRWETACYCRDMGCSSRICSTGRRRMDGASDESRQWIKLAARFFCALVEFELVHFWLVGLIIFSIHVQSIWCFLRSSECCLSGGKNELGNSDSVLRWNGARWSTLAQTFSRMIFQHKIYIIRMTHHYC